HPGPSIAIGFATGWVYHQCDRLCAEPGSDRASRGPGVAAGVVAVSTAAAVNMGNEAYEWVTATDVTGNPTKPEISQPDIAVGTGSVALTLVIAAAVAKYRSLGRTA
ncbi:hypothetical protein KDA14_05585, partial [Candidatus Saccharibacteria bacterium]|nr:hypothetical protein [Candidatus Saccharibacteria bacterium]